MNPSFLNKKRIKESFVGVDRNALATQLGSSRNTIDQVANGLIITSAKRAVDIEKATSGRVHASDLRPDIFN